MGTFKDCLHYMITVFSTSASGLQFHLLLGAEEPATLLHYLCVFHLIFETEPLTINNKGLSTSYFNS